MPSIPDNIDQLRTLLQHLDHSSACDPATAEVLRRLILSRIRAIESVEQHRDANARCRAQAARL